MDVVTEEGTFIRGVVETGEPGELARRLVEEFEVPGDLLMVEEGRLTVAVWVLEELAGELDEPCFIVEEYPTADRLEVERRSID